MFCVMVLLGLRVDTMDELKIPNGYVWWGLVSGES